ncbi:hypothetical protein ACWGOQ_0020480 [Aquimarina sp. M1]
MKLIIVKFLIIILLVSCKKKEKENSTIVKEIVNSERIIAENLNSYCFYKLDDKYSTEKDSLIISNWLKEKSQIILKNDSIHNIFQRNGGGPNGAEWNPATDLFIAVLTSTNVPTKAPKIYLNGKLHKNQVYKYSPNLIWYKVKYNVWKQKVKDIEPEDIQKMFSAEFLNGVKNGEFKPIVALDYGEVLRFDISYKKNRITKHFHATYGE